MIRPRGVRLRPAAQLVEGDRLDGRQLTGELKQAALAAGIDLLGVTSAEPFDLGEDWWGHDQPRDVLAGARSVVVAGFCSIYEPRPVESEPGNPRGVFTAFGSRVYVQMERHCWDVVGCFLREHGYAAVDAPRLPIKPAVVRSGLGKYGKHAVVITPELGSMVMFACTVTDAPLTAVESDAPVRAQTCPPRCRRCIDACPTNALDGAYGLDRSRCITNWLWGERSPAEWRDKQERRLFGCALCLLACPLSARIPRRTSHPVPTDTVDDCPELLPLAAGDDDYYDQAIPTFPRRAGRDAMRGSAIVALGNAGDPAAVETLGRTIAAENPQLRAYSAWSLGQLGTNASRTALEAALAVEQDAAVAVEIEDALSRCG
jgi:epoxyqueuosine reductase